MFITDFEKSAIKIQVFRVWIAIGTWDNTYLSLRSKTHYFCFMGLFRIAPFISGREKTDGFKIEFGRNIFWKLGCFLSVKRLECTKFFLFFATIVPHTASPPLRNLSVLCKKNLCS